MKIEDFFKIPRRKEPNFRFSIGKYDPIKNQSLPRGYDGRGYASGVWDNGNIVGFEPVSNTSFVSNTYSGSSGDGGNSVSIESKNDLEKEIKKEKKYKYGCFIAYLSDPMSNWIYYWAKQHIPEEHIYINCDSTINGYEIEHFIPLLYGVENLDEIVVDEILNIGIDILNKIRFEEIEIDNNNSDFDIVKLNINKNDLLNLYDFLSHSVNYKNIIKKFEPCIYIAFVKKGLCDNLNGNRMFYGIIDEPDVLSYCDVFGETYDYWK